MTESRTIRIGPEGTTEEVTVSVPDAPHPRYEGGAFSYLGSLSVRATMLGLKRCPRFLNASKGASP